MFPQVHDLSLQSLTISFTEQNLLMFVKSGLSIISFIGCANDVQNKMVLTNPVFHLDFSSVLSSRNFIDLVFMFRFAKLESVLLKATKAVADSVGRNKS